MTVSFERLERLTDVPAVRGMTEQHSLVDPYDDAHTIVGLRVVVSRDQLAAAVEMGGHSTLGTERHPDEWTIAEIRYFAEFQIIEMSGLELQRGAEAMAQMAEPDFYCRPTHEIVLAVYRAVDRAYPKAVRV
ncbi:hypothetical protein R6V09_12360 [Streptomyces sp. W16]|uniref:hypothetical protein n=1 Tax=Streptomyces sp. W16 TaxID=3076631 RepID=UPI00295C1A4B|nr:hypothetical protein [Streptomyces sp. W16]MDV9170924.1 hypothetical protein [Streptomyces sp. W16]